MFNRRRKIIGRDGANVYIFAPAREMAAEFIAFTQANAEFHRPWVFPATDATTYRAYLDRLDRGQAFGFVIARKTDDEIVGVVNVNDVIMGGFCSASLGYYGSGPHARRGHMAEGLGLVLDHAFGELGLHRIEANMQPDNAASRALVARLGFRQEGFSPAFLQIDGVWCDHERWAILAAEWQARRPAYIGHVSRIV